MPASEMTRENYLSTAHDCRTLLEDRHGSTIKQIEDRIKSDPDTNTTYCGMVKFLQTELFGSLAGKSYRQRLKVQKDSAKRMMQTSEAFTLAIRTYRSSDVRLSMHPSSGMGKLSVALVPSPKGFFQKSPWHSCVAIDSDNGYHSVHSDEVRDTHELMYKGDRPYCYIAKDAVQVDNPDIKTLNNVAVVEQSGDSPATEKPEIVVVDEKQEIITSVKPVTENQEHVPFVEEQPTVTFESQDAATVPDNKQDVVET